MILQIDEVMENVNRYKETVQELEAEKNSLQRQVWVNQTTI